MNPLVPSVYDGALMAVSLGALILALTAFASVVRAGHVSGWRFLAWVVLVFVIPIIGPAA